MLSRNRSTTRQIKLVLLAVLLCTGIGPILSPALHAQADPVTELMAGMTSAEKVGQLFVVAFWGRNPSPPSRAGQLIQQHKIGGVVLITSNNNLVNAQSPPEQTAADVSRLCNTLQGMALEEAGSGIPLFIAIDHEGDGYPYTRITNGTTPLPNPMAIGATWDTRYAEQVGEIAGRELSAMGINMLLGPVVDVLDAPRPGDKGDIGTRAFGGDPYWVGEMGRAYVRGVHVGSQGQILTVAKHFPGHGGSDRLPDDEIATVDKSLQELKRVELAPFFALTTPQDPDDLDRTDAMMSSHIRYRGFYGDIRQFTRPISFDAESMQAILDLPEFREWREDGLMISDSLGVPAVRKYFDPQLQTFPHRQIAREAFLAGNDVLILSEFALISDWAQQYDNVVEVLAYFRETYDSDPAFAARVDESVARILRFKLQLYPDLSPEQVLVSPEEQAEIGQGTAIVDQIARQATTVLQSTVSSLPAPPRRDEDILIFAEDRMIQECFDTIPECDSHTLVPPTALEEAILRLYGPEGTGQVDRQRIDTRTFAQLKTYLTQREGDVGTLLEEAEWIVFAMLDPNPRYPDSDALQLFLAQNAHQIYNAKVIGLTYTAPYYLDATEISKLTAYYVFYSKTLPFIEASARTLFGEVRPPGRSPVSIEGTYYDLGTQLAPDPDQQIVLERIEPAQDSAIVPCTVRVRTHTIHDRNGNPVPDGTPVQFIARDGESQQLVDTATALTVSGVAEADLSIDRPGRIVVVASSGDTGEGPPVSLQALAEPTPTPPPPTRTPTLTPQVTPTATARSTAAPTPTVKPAPTFVPTPQTPSLRAILNAWQGQPRDLPGVLGGMLLAAGVGYLWWGHKARRPYRIRPVLLAWIGGLLGYVLHGWGWVPVSAWTGWPAWLGSGIAACAGALILVIAARLGMRERPTESSGTAPAR